MTLLKKFLITLLIISTGLAGKTIAQESSLLWSIEGPGLEHTSYLYGTMHLLCSEYMDISESVSNALESADLLALEIDMTDPGMASQMMALGMLPDGKTIMEYMNDDDAELLDGFLRQHYGVGLDQMGTMKPFMLSSMTLLPLISCEGEQESVDGFLMMKAVENDIPVTGLETIAFQTGLFDDIPLQEQVDELIEIVRDTDAGMEEFERLSRLYASQNIREMYELITEDEFWQNHKEVLLDSRNQAWIPVIEELARDQRVFIGVGAGHLAGENGVINLLRQRGFTVNPVE
ncbi:MAG: TraB/GumN family protein [Balneolia bacterium]|nr:TraB/GumN family protein [Balneolia bacterium]